MPCKKKLKQTHRSWDPPSSSVANNNNNNRNSNIIWSTQDYVQKAFKNPQAAVLLHNPNPRPPEKKKKTIPPELLHQIHLLNQAIRQFGRLSEKGDGLALIFQFPYILGSKLPVVNISGI